MTEITHWVVVPPDMKQQPYELKDQAQLIEEFEFYKDRTYLVTDRAWRDYTEAVTRLDLLRKDLQRFNRPSLTVVANRYPPAVSDTGRDAANG